MEERTKIHVGLDVHKDSITVATAEPGRENARLIGKVAHDVPKLLKVLVKIGAGDELHVVYEAGPTGYGLHRALTKRGYACEVIAPSKTPRQAGNRVKTDARDSLELAEYSRAGKLTAVWIPIRPMRRSATCRGRARTQSTAAGKCDNSSRAFCCVMTGGGKTSWCGAHDRWLARQSFEAAAAQTGFTEYWQAVKSADERVERLTKALQGSIAGWRFESVVNAFQAMRSVAAITAIGLVAVIGDLNRFEHTRKLMGYLGLVPSEHSSGERTSRGSITKTGNGHARRLLVEAAWNYWFKARIGKEINARQEGLSEAVRTMAWKGQQRLTERYAALQ
jgi:transposase